MLSETFLWKSHPATCEVLLSYLETTPPPAADDTPAGRWRARREHVHAAQLLRVLALRESAGALRRVLLDRSQDCWIRVCCLNALVNVGEGVRPHELAGLFDEERRGHDALRSCLETEPTADESPAARRRAASAGPPPVPARELLPLVRDEAALAAARAAVERLSPTARAELLADAPRRDQLQEPAGRQLLDELYEGWLSSDRHQLDGRLNDKVAQRTDERASSRAIRVAALRSISDPEERQRRVRFVAHYPEFEALERQAPEIWREAHESFERPTWSAGDADAAEEDLEPWPSDLLPRLEEEIRRISSALRVPAEDPGPKPKRRDEQRTWGKRARAIRRRRRDLELRGHVVVNLLLSRRAGRDRLVAVLESDPHPLYRRKLERGLWTHDPDRALVWLTSALRASTTELGTWVLSAIAEDPDEVQLEVLRRAVGHDTPAFRYLGLHGLDALGSIDDTLLDRLVADPDVFVRLRAHAARAARGDRASEGALVEHATDRSRPVRVRAEAVRWLATLDPVRHFELLETALLTDHESDDDYHAPVGEEAAFGVARVGTDAALTVLVRAALAARSNPVGGALDCYLRTLLNWREGRAERSQEEPPAPGGAPVTIHGNLWRGRLLQYPGT